MSEALSATWVDIGPVADIAKRRKVVHEIDDRQILVVSHEGRFFAFENICIHRQRELSRGVVLNGRLICPGHQWAFDLSSGWESIKEECQPTYDVRVVDEIVQVDVDSKAARVAQKTV